MFNVIKNFFTKKVLDLGAVREYETHLELEESKKVEKNYIICNDVKYEIDTKVIFKPLSKNTYKSVKKIRNPKMIVTHWDVALSSESCYNILNKNSISTHFSIDNDGTIYQFVDTNNVAWHAGPTNIDRNIHKDLKLSFWNDDSIGIDLSNAYYLKYQDTYIKRGFGPRPILNYKLNGRNLGPFLGFYPAQIESYTKLLKVLHGIYGIPLEHPTPLNAFSEDAATGKFNGVVNHYNLTKNKIDCAGLDLTSILNNIKKG